MAESLITFHSVDQGVFDRAAVDTPDDRPCMIATMTGRDDNKAVPPRKLQVRLSLADAVEIHALLGLLIAEQFESARDSLRSRAVEIQRGTLPPHLLTAPTALASHRSRTEAPPPRQITVAEIGQVIRSRRESLGLSLTALGEKASLHFTGIYRAERGLNCPRMKTLRKLAQALDFPELLEMVRGGICVKMPKEGSESVPARRSASGQTATHP